MGKVRKLQGPRPAKGCRVRAEPLVVVVVPTRELAQQIYDEARRLCYRSMLRPVCAYGGIPMGINLQELGKGCDLLIGTPGRLQDLMNKPDVLSMRRVKFTVIDEADEMLTSDWETEMNKIMGGGGKLSNIYLPQAYADSIRCQRRPRSRISLILCHVPKGVP